MRPESGFPVDRSAGEDRLGRERRILGIRLAYEPTNHQKSRGQQRTRSRPRHCAGAASSLSVGWVNPPVRDIRDWWVAPTHRIGHTHIYGQLPECYR